jgi:predicted nucleic-acid-binding Zn-ribbon protein
MIEELLSSATLVTEELTYTTDEDGNFQIVQNNSFIVMTPKQCLDLKEVLSVHLDILNRGKVC